MIWIFTDTEWQPVASRLVTHITEAGGEVEVFDPERSPRLTIEISGTDLEVRDAGRPITQPTSVIGLRTPIPPTDHQGDLDNDALHFVATQWSVLFNGLYRALEYRGATMLNPAIAALADEKTHQMLAAAQAGLQTLPSVHSARGAAVIGRWPEATLAAKPFHPVVRRELHEGRQQMIRTIAMSSRELGAGLDASLVKSPSIVQPFVAAPFEHRVVVVGDTVHGARMPRVGGAEIDIRSVPVTELGATPSKLPTDVTEACVRLVRSVGAVVAAIDLLEDADGRFVFLDLNCAGHYLFVEQLTGAPICADIAALALAS